MARLPSRSIALFFALTFIAIPQFCQAEVKLYLSPAGNDAWSGRLAEPNTPKTDGPVLTPAHARDVARAVKAKSPGEPIVIDIRGGTYFLNETVVLDSADSGSEKAPITWQAHSGETPVFSAGRRIENWQKTSLNGQEVWSAKVPADLDAFFFRELWVNGQRAQRARWPKVGTFAVGETTKPKSHAEWRHPESEIPFIEKDLKPFPTAGDGDVITCSKWVEARLPISGIDEAQHRIQSSKKAAFHPETGDRYWLENIKECLTDPGEWYLDPRTHVVYLIPPAGVNSPNEAEIIAPRLARILQLNGSTGKDAGAHPVEHISFHGITFAHNEWYFDHVATGETPQPDLTGFNQAAVGVPGAIRGEGVCHCIFDHCTIAHVSGYGLELARACHDNLIEHCTLTDLGGGGVKLGETAVRDDAADQTFANKVSNCRITDGGNLFASAIGVWIGQSHDNTISHNEISSFWYTGISVGWTWGYGKSLAQNNLIEFNDVSLIGIKHLDDQPILSDMGGIYTLGNEKGTVIKSNYFHDISALKYGGWGIYFDEGTTDILAEDNVVQHTKYDGFHQHYGKDNLLHNNIFAFGELGQIQRTRIEDHRSFTFENNTVIWSTNKLLNGDWKKLNVEFDNNHYFCKNSQDVRFSKFSWDEWRGAGMDKHSTLSDIKTCPNLQNGRLKVDERKYGPTPG